MKKSLEISGILLATSLLVSVAVRHSDQAYDGCRREWELKQPSPLTGHSQAASSDFPFHVFSITTE